MRIVIQRVNSSSVSVANKKVGSIGRGLLLLVGITHEDNEQDADWLSKKVNGLRLFRDRDDKMNFCIKDIDGELLVVSQFTLFASTKKGARPSFLNAAKTDDAERLYEYLKIILTGELGKAVESGVFGADMKLNIENDGPVTILLDSKNKE